MTAEMKGKRVVLLLGAGATVADAGSCSQSRTPPLDQGFFRASSRIPTTKRDVDGVGRYMQDIYGIDIAKQPHDSLEAVMARIYTDISDPALKDHAIPGFRTLIALFNRRVGDV